MLKVVTELAAFNKDFCTRPFPAENVSLLSNSSVPTPALNIRCFPILKFVAWQVAQAVRVTGHWKKFATRTPSLLKKNSCQNTSEVYMKELSLFSSRPKFSRSNQLSYNYIHGGCRRNRHWLLLVHSIFWLVTFKILFSLMYDKLHKLGAFMMYALHEQVSRALSVFHYSCRQSNRRQRNKDHKIIEI